ncbi:hypothetical protein BJ170DRAFT_599406 [Xylariales sp. AK1849]|nr:hypothetical protein BJ170DRAFT_599406 [Xylariales sp. AK1849]
MRKNRLSRTMPSQPKRESLRIPSRKNRDQTQACEERSPGSGDSHGVFHYFTRFPMEIQLMIWPSIRHYFCLEAAGRGYAAFDTKTRQCIKTTAKSAEPNQDDPLDPMEYKIRFTNKVFTLPTGSDTRVDCILGGRTFRTQRTLAPAYAWVNFQRDPFIIENTSYGFPGRLRFLLSGIGAKMPRELDTSHWGSRIQKLCFYLIPMLIENACDDLDRKVFTRMNSLRTVYLVTILSSRCSYRVHLNGRADRHGYASIQNMNHSVCPSNGYFCSPLNWRNPATDPEQKKAEMIVLLMESGRQNVEVKVVVDTLYDAW